MENQIYRLKLSGGNVLELSVFDTNEVEPFRKVKEIGVSISGKGMQIDACIDINELNSLIRYLDNCREYIEDYNQPK